MSNFQKLPSWFKQEIPSGKKIQKLNKLLDSTGLHTVCQGTRCPNTGQCWSQGVATFMILGNICTRGCRFCAVETGRPQKVDINEPSSVAQAVRKLDLNYVVITSVTRDDLPDQGAHAFAQTIQRIKELSPDVKIETLIPDFSGESDLLRIVLEVAPDVLSHNIETVPRLFKEIRPQADYKRSLDILRKAKAINDKVIIKSGFMVGLGETSDEIRDLMLDLKSAGCEILTIGQYLTPIKSERHVAVERFVEPKEFAIYRDWGYSFGFSCVMSAPLMRSSFLAEGAYRDYLQRESEKKTQVQEKIEITHFANV